MGSSAPSDGVQERAKTELDARRNVIEHQTSIARVRDWELHVRATRIALT